MNPCLEDALHHKKIAEIFRNNPFPHLTMPKYGSVILSQRLKDEVKEATYELKQELDRLNASSDPGHDKAGSFSNAGQQFQESLKSALENASKIAMEDATHRVGSPELNLLLDYVELKKSDLQNVAAWVSGIFKELAHQIRDFGWNVVEKPAHKVVDQVLDCIDSID